MKVHYINILFFALPLYLLVNTHQKTSITHHTQTNRSLCECELYTPANYDNDPQMKEVMQQFDDRTSQRFHEYDDRMVEKRRQCKEQCDKEIEKIILKDKLEKQMAQQLTTLDTNITTEDIPTCVCEKSLADKMEKFCLNCGMNVGGGVTLSSGVLGGIGGLAVNAWKPAALKATIEKALELYAGRILAEAVKAGQVAGKKALIAGLDALKIEKLGIGSWESFINPVDYTDVSKIVKIILEKKPQMCGAVAKPLDGATCNEIGKSLGTYIESGYAPPDSTVIPQTINGIVEGTKEVAETQVAATKAGMEATVKTTQKGVIDAASIELYNAISYSVIAIIIIVLIMIIIYLVLRYRRKKKMKKKLQYIKLLEE
ncbi:rifin PIR protein,putative [Plasmodium sp. DRC-Itaito]|nr:rifin PIR protein,putative [Plasmodium sp. DRC-Itaito]